MKAKGIIIFIIIVGVVVGLFASGIVDFESVWGQVRRVFYGSQQVLSGPKPGNVQNAAICRENLRQIESGKRRVADEKGWTHGARVTWDDVCRVQGWKEPPKCPDGGVYALNPIGNLPYCSISDNKTLDNDDDHTIRNY